MEKSLNGDSDDMTWNFMISFTAPDELTELNIHSYSANVVYIFCLT